MNWALLRHIAWALFTTLFCVCTALGVADVLSYRIPAGLDEAFALKGLFFIAFIAALIYIPAIKATQARARKLIRSFIGIVALSASVAVLSSTGGGTVRRLITNDATIFSSPLHVWWQAVFYGWALGLSACGMGLNIYQRTRLAKVALDNIDAWIMGVFAVAGAMAARGWRPFGDFSDNIFVQMFIASLLAMVTGAVGGLVAKIFARLTFAFNGVRALFADLGTWALAAYTHIGFGVGLFAYVAFRAVTTIFPLKTVSADEFLKSSVDVGTFVRDLTDPPTALQTTWAQSLFLTTNGLILVFYVIFGFSACYMFRSSEHSSVAWLRDGEDAGP